MVDGQGELNTVIRTFTREVQAQIAEAVLDANNVYAVNLLDSPPPPAQ